MKKRVVFLSAVFIMHWLVGVFDRHSHTKHVDEVALLLVFWSLGLHIRVPTTQFEGDWGECCSECCPHCVRLEFYDAVFTCGVMLQM